jgi:environmental stress-induced protein Ves
MRHLTQADYTRQPWKNGKGVTVELAREDRDGALLWRLSMATVAEDGPFSVFPGVERNLTVLTGPGFRLVGCDVALECLPLRPVAFAGDVPVRAEGTAGQVSTDFNVMTARGLPLPEVAVVAAPCDLAAGGLLALFALDAVGLVDRRMSAQDLILTDGPLRMMSGVGLAVRLHRLSD